VQCYSGVTAELTVDDEVSARLAPYFNKLQHAPASRSLISKTGLLLK